MYMLRGDFESLATSIMSLRSITAQSRYWILRVLKSCGGEGIKENIAIVSNVN